MIIHYLIIQFTGPVSPTSNIDQSIHRVARAGESLQNNCTLPVLKCPTYTLVTVRCRTTAPWAAAMPIPVSAAVPTALVAVAHSCGSLLVLAWVAAPAAGWCARVRLLRCWHYA